MTIRKDLDTIILETAVQQLVTPDQAWHYEIIPVSLNRDNHSIVLLCSAIPSIETEQEIAFLLNGKVSFQQIEKPSIYKLLNQYYRRGNRGENTFAGNLLGEDFLEMILREGKALKASDIHIEAYDDHARIRYRIDGKLIERHRVKKSDYPPLINKIKIKASLDISEKRLPQDGRITLKQEKDNFDIRVSIVPTLHGEKVVLRYLGNDASKISIKALGLSESQEEIFLKAIRKQSGIILISGPTGSGKTTTLYGTLQLLNQESRNIMTIEDPIEYTLEGVNQVQLKESIGLTFSSALRTFLRQDPDIIMVGEIRDQETAEMAIRASLTGHLVFSTIHTNSAVGTIDRLIDMGIPAFLIAATLNMSVAQRLVRKLCEKCLIEEDLPHHKLPNYQGRHYAAVGCEHCHYTGYSGRIGVYEILDITQEIAQEIKFSSNQLEQSLKQRGHKTIAEQCIDLVRKGITSADEIYPFLLER